MPPRRFTGEWRVVAAVFAGLLVAEVALRTVQNVLSGDVAHLNAADSIVSDLDRAEGLRVLLIGNSLLYRGVDPAQLESLLEAELDREVSIGMVFPDGTLPLEWSYLYRKLVFNPDRLPDVMVMAFGPGHLGDRPAEPQLLRLAAHHVAASDVGMLFERDLTGFEERAEFIVARVSTAFALRDRIAPRVFDRLIPGYRDLAPMLLQAPNGAVGSAPPPEPTFEYLGRLLDDASADRVPLIALPMPAPTAYSLHPDASAALRSHGDPVLATLGDLGLEPERFYDGQHLDPAGRTRFTNLVAPLLAAEIVRLGL